MNAPSPQVAGTGLLGCPRPLAEAYDVGLFDLDGVLYVGDDPVAYAVDALVAAERLGMRRTFVTNNARRTPEQVAERLRAMGIDADPQEVATSAQAAARILGERLTPGALVLVAGAEGLHAAVRGAGFRVTTQADDAPSAVVLGFDPTLDYGRLAEASLAASRGALFVACNRDATIPSPRGAMPGMGALTAFVQTGSGQQPVVAGKPERALHEEAVARTAARNPLVIGDRLDTDAAGAHTVGVPCLLVFTGVTGAEELFAAPAHMRPSYVATDLRGLLSAHPAAAAGECNDARAAVRDGVLKVEAGADPLDALRAAATAAWAATDRGETWQSVTGLPPQTTA